MEVRCQVIFFVSLAVKYFEVLSGHVWMTSTFKYHETAANWTTAVITCQNDGGLLADFNDVTVVMDITDQVREAKNISVWIGLQFDGTKWVPLNATSTSSGSARFCPILRLNANMTRSETICQETRSFFCSHPGGYCRYRKFPETGIVGYNTFTALSVSLSRCRQICDETTEFVCMSFEYNSNSRYCQLSNTNRWLVTDTSKFAYHASWDYYHRTCILAYNKRTDNAFYTTTGALYSTMPPSTIQDTVFTSQAWQYKLYHDVISWPEARDFCSEEGGFLATINDESVIPEAGLISKTPDKVWIGLTRHTTGKWHWTNGTQTTWTNWRYPPNNLDLTENCTTVLLNNKSWWFSEQCFTRRPFICQFKTDSCRFTRHENSVLIVHNRRTLYNISENKCRHLCETSIDFDCRSFEFNFKEDICQLSDQNRWTVPGYFLSGVDGWIYYHKQCNFEWISVSTISESTEIPESTTPITELSSTESIRQPPSFDTQIQELKELGDAARQKRKDRSRSSAWDARPSATSVGVAAIVILVSIFGAMIVFDATTICLHCKQIHSSSKKKSKKYRYVSETPSKDNENNIRDRGTHQKVIDSHDIPNQETPDVISDNEIELTVNGTLAKNENIMEDKITKLYKCVLLLLFIIMFVGRNDNDIDLII